MIPSHPFELLVYQRDGRIQTREYQTLGAAFAAAQELKPSIYLGWRLTVVLDSKTLYPPRPNR